VVGDAVEVGDDLIDGGGCCSVEVGFVSMGSTVGGEEGTYPGAKRS